MDTMAEVIRLAVGLIAFLVLCVGVQALVRARRARRQPSKPLFLDESWTEPKRERPEGNRHQRPQGPRRSA